MYRCRYLCGGGVIIDIKIGATPMYSFSISGLLGKITVIACYLLTKPDFLSAWPTLMCRLAIS